MHRETAFQCGVSKWAATAAGSMSALLILEPNQDRAGGKSEQYDQAYGQTAPQPVLRSAG